MQYSTYLFYLSTGEYVLFVHDIWLPDAQQGFVCKFWFPWLSAHTNRLGDYIPVYIFTLQWGKLQAQSTNSLYHQSRHSFTLSFENSVVHHGSTCISLLSKTESLNDAIQEFPLAQPSWYLSRYRMLYIYVKRTRYFRDVFNETVIPLHLLDMRWLQKTRRLFGFLSSHMQQARVE